jgi:phosphoribosylformylglycinamidine cyclo-ligase
MKQETLTYASTGVDYSSIDPFKLMAQRAAAQTAGNLARFGFSELPESRGESAYLIDTEIGYLAHVEEGLGTKNVVADEMKRLTGKCYYREIAHCTVAMMVNDLITLGAMPVSIAMHLAAGESDWFKDEERAAALVEGFKEACNLSGASWGGGETPTLKGIIVPGTSLLSGSAIGIVHPKSNLIVSKNIQEGDVILFVQSSGIHANGLSLARDIASRIPKGYLAELPDRKTFGEELLRPTRIYVKLIRECFVRGVNIHYAMNITGHGWRKIMRAKEPWRYVIHNMPKWNELFGFLREKGPLTPEEAYSNLNMGAGFALIVAPEDVHTVSNAAAASGDLVMIAGHVEKGEKSVYIEPLDLEFKGESLAIR